MTELKRKKFTTGISEQSLKDLDFICAKMEGKIEPLKKGSRLNRSDVIEYLVQKEIKNLLRKK